MSPTRSVRPYGSRARQVLNKKEKVPFDLVPHFRGFYFENQSDELWLNHESKSSREVRLNCNPTVNVLLSCPSWTNQYYLLYLYLASFAQLKRGIVLIDTIV
jgi:hypothetical protein